MAKKNIISENEINNFPRVQKNFFLISDLFNSFEIKLPDTSLANQKSHTISHRRSIT